MFSKYKPSKVVIFINVERRNNDKKMRKKRIGRPMNEMKRYQGSKRAGGPMNEMKRAIGSKRAGRPVNEMKRTINSKFGTALDDDNVQGISPRANLEDNIILKHAVDALEHLKTVERDLFLMNKRATEEMKDESIDDKELSKRDAAPTASGQGEEQSMVRMTIAQ